jgi:hypothetical protein
VEVVDVRLDRRLHLRVNRLICLEERKICVRRSARLQSDRIGVSESSERTHNIAIEPIPKITVTLSVPLGPELGKRDKFCVFRGTGETTTIILCRLDTFLEEFFKESRELLVSQLLQQDRRE